MDPRLAAKKALQAANSKGRFKLPDGETIFRVFPNALGMEDHADFECYYIHADVGPDKRYVRCGKDASTNEGSCWICDYLLPKMYQSKNPATRQAAQKMEKKDCFAVQIIYKDNITGEWRGPVVYDTSVGVMKSLLQLFQSSRRYTHPVKGYNLTILKSGQGLKTRYSGITADATPTPVPKALWAKLKPFDQLLPEYSEAKQKANYYGHDQETEVIPPEDEEPVAGAEGTEEATEFVEDFETGEAVKETGVEEAGFEEEVTEESSELFEAGEEATEDFVEEALEEPAEEITEDFVEEGAEEFVIEEPAPTPKKAAPKPAPIKVAAPAPKKAVAPPPAKAPVKAQPAPIAKPVAKLVTRPAAAPAQAVRKPVGKK